MHKALVRNIIRDARKLRKEVDTKDRKIKKLEKKKC